MTKLVAHSKVGYVDLGKYVFVLNTRGGEILPYTRDNPCILYSNYALPRGYDDPKSEWVSNPDGG